MKKEDIGWEKMFEQHISNKELLIKIYKNFPNTMVKRQITQYIMEKIFEHFIKNIDIQ